MKSVVALSGGIDSLVTAMMLEQKGDELILVNFHYGSKHGQWEQEAALNLANYLSPKRFISIDLSKAFSSFHSNLLQSGGEIPEGHYADTTMSKTVVPGRNLIFASIMTGIAQSNDANSIALGIHQGDHAIYADCRPEFAEHLNKTIQAATEGMVNVVTPLLRKDKVQIVKWGLEHAAPFELTRTCYKDQATACGRCGACVERREAFAKNNMIDPIKYEGEI